MYYRLPQDRKFTAIKQVEVFSADNQIKPCTIIFSVYGLPSEVASDTGTNFVSKEFDEFYK